MCLIAQPMISQNRDELPKGGLFSTATTSRQ